MEDDKKKQRPDGLAPEADKEKAGKGKPDAAPKDGSDKADSDKQSTVLIPQEWLYNPVVYSQISGDFSLMQQRVLVGILDQLQDRIKRGISYQKQMHLWPSLFDEDELNDNIVMEIDPRSLGVIPANYDYLKEALEALMKIQIGYVKRGKTKDRYVMAPLFARAELPYYKDRRTGKIRIVMLKENVQDFFNLSMGYTIHMAKVAQLCQKKRTPRIYIYLSSLRQKGGDDVDYEVLCKFLGIDEDTARADLITRLDEQVKQGEISKKERNERLEKWENPYRKFTKVKSLILEPSRLELDELVRRGDIDFSFTYEPVYENGRKRGNPVKIRFNIEKGPLAEDFDVERRNRDSRRNFIDTLCAWPYGLRTEELRDVVENIPNDDFNDFKDYCFHDLRRMVEKRQPDDADAYILALMNDWLKKRKAKRQRQEQQEQLFAAERRQQHFRELWQQCHQDLLSQTTNDKSRAIVGSLIFNSYDEEKKLLFVIAPSYLVYEYMIQTYIVKDILGPTLNRHFGCGVKLQYLLKRQK